MKPVPSKVALLMSAAGLGISLPTLAVGHGDACTWPPIESDASAHTSPYANCARLARNGQTTYRLSSVESLGTSYDDATVDDARRSLELRWSSADFDDDSAGSSSSAASTPAGDDPPARAEGSSHGPTPSRSGELPALGRRAEAPEIDAQPTAQLSADGVYRDYDANAIAMVLMADAPMQTHWQAWNAVAPGRVSDNDSPALSDGASHATRQAYSFRVLGPLEYQVERPEPTAATPVERALGDLARIVATRTDEPALHPAAVEPQTESQRHRTVDGVGSAAVGETPRVPSAFGEDIVVATHVDRVLMSLDALLSDEARRSEWRQAQPRQTVVSSQSEKVLETLALFKNSAAKPSTELVDHKPSVEPLAGAVDTPPPPRRRPVGEHALALSGDRLDEVRGGFVGENGLKISFGIERAIYLNGNLVATNSLNVADLSKITGGQAQVTTSGTGVLALVQSGQGVTFQPSAISQTAGGIVIQNALDNQSIQSITRINAVVNSSSVIKSMNLQSSMRSAVIDSLRR
jgi:hypothetical protein